MEGAQSVARYVAPAGGTVFAMACNGMARTVTLAAAGQAAGDEPMTVTTTEAQRVLTAHTVAGGLNAALPVSDPLLDAMAFSRGRFMVELPGVPALILPSWTEVSRVTEDCRIEK